MKPSRRRILHLAAGGLLLPALSRRARAQAYPDRPIRLVVPFPPGGAFDAVGRPWADRMKSLLGTIVVENMGGGGSSLGAAAVARAKADGYTILLGGSLPHVNEALGVARAAADGYTLCYAAFATHVVSPAVNDLPYNVLTDFEPIALISRTPWFIAARQAVPANDLQGLIAWLKANPDKASLGTPGVGSPGHIGGILFQKLTSTGFSFVPYRGTAPAAQDLVAGQIDLAILDPVTCLPQLRAGRIKVFAVMAKSRTANAPDIPTVDEAGVSGLYMAPWQGMWAPKGTPADIIARLNAAVVQTLADPAVRQKLAELSYEVGPPAEQTPDYFGAFLKAETETWWPIIKAAGIKPQ
jgi:tripartite-type tricarboxylate transporter receptor subunit TctC